MPEYPAEQCRVCGGATFKIPVGKAAIGGHKCANLSESLAVSRLPLMLRYCEQCHFTQYCQISHADEVLSQLYEDQHSTYDLIIRSDPYLADFACRLNASFPDSGGLVLEIGCNDGALLSELKVRFGRRVLGVEPGKNFSKIWLDRNIDVINDFFDTQVARTLKNKIFDIVIVRHVLEHIADPVAFLTNVAAIMSAHTTLVIESPYLVTVLREGRFENISYAHLNHFTIRSINTMCGNLGLGITNVRLVDTDGGSFVACLRPGEETQERLLDSVSRQELEEFLRRMYANGDRVRDRLSKFSPGEVIGYGAGAKGPHLLSLYNLGDLISEVVDDNPAFHGLFLAGTGARIVSPETLKKERIRAVLNLAPTHTKTIRSKIPPAIELVEII